MKQLKIILAKKSGRASSGNVSVRHQGGRQKRFLRMIDFKRDKRDIKAKVEAIEHDPNRNARIALLVYLDGERKYILAPEGLAVGRMVVSSELAPLEVGNCLPLSKMPIGTPIHNIELTPGKGGEIVKSAGSVALVQGKDETNVLVKLPSGEVRKFDPSCFATVGQLGNIEFRTKRLGKAGTRRKMGIRPRVRGVAMHPDAHPHGGGEGRSGVGMKYPKTPWGKPAVGKTRNKRKYSNSRIVERRKKGKHS